MMKGLKFAVVSAIFLSPFAFPHGALAWIALSYEEAAWYCSTGNLQACDVMQAYEEAASGVQELARQTDGSVHRSSSEAACGASGADLSAPMISSGSCSPAPLAG
jgi:hypothetical protein